MYNVDQSEADPVSRSTFIKCYKAHWAKVLIFRNIGQGKRCKVCARLDAERLLAMSKQERQELMQRKQCHIDEVMADRAINVRGNKIAELDTQKPNGHGEGQLLNSTIDGMGQSKFKCPRNLAN